MDYMTAGELAQSVGITLRAVQYYDQLGLLSPSERGSNNLRLYSQKDQQQLYRILVLKYLGLTLSQIRETLDEFDTNEAVAQLIDNRLEAVEAEFHDLFKRLQALNIIRGDLAALSEPDWRQFAITIENVQNQGPLVWQAVAATGDSASADNTTEHGLECREYLVRLHELIGKDVDMMRADDPLTSAPNRDFAERARALLTTSDGHVSSSFLVMGSTFPHSSSHEGFNGLSSSVTNYIQSVIDASNPLSEEEQDL